MAKALFALIIFLAVIVRVFQFNQIPAALNPDEVALGYTAFSILTTGADEHGRTLPLMFESFGDWKMPLYAYLTVISVAILGLTETATRLASLLSGIGSVALLFFITKKLFNSTKVALIAGIFMAVSPWSIFFSRMAMEANLANFLFLSALLLHLKNKHFLSLILFSSTVFTYHTFSIFTPIFVIFLYVFDRKNIKPTKIIILGFLILILLTASSWIVLKSSATSKVADVGFYTNIDVLYNRVNQFRTPSDGLLTKLIHNKITGFSYQFGQNYLLSYNPSFLFDKGGQKVLHNTGFTGVLLLTDAIFLVIGLLFLFKARPFAWKILLVWLIAAPISSSLTLDHPSSTRLYIALPALVMLSAYGVKVAAKNIVLILLVSTLVFAASLFFLDGYFNFLNLKRATFMGAGFKEAVLETAKFPSHKVIWARAQEFPYIYVLFYNQINPREFQKSVQYFDTTPEGFRLVKHFGRFSFPSSLNKSGMEPPDFKKNTVYVERFGVHNNLRAIKLPSGEPRFFIYVSDHDGY